MPRPDRIMERNNNHTQQNGGNGFLLGVIVGVILTLLITTKRGRAILKEVLERGAEKFANLEQIMREAAQEDEYSDDDEEGDDYIVEPITETPKVHKVEKKTEEVTLSEEETPPPPKPFKESPKFLDEALAEEEISEEEQTAPASEIEKPKAAKVKRLFRGLRKRVN